MMSANSFAGTAPTVCSHRQLLSCSTRSPYSDRFPQATAPVFPGPTSWCRPRGFNEAHNCAPSHHTPIERRCFNDPLAKADPEIGEEKR